MSLAYFPLYPDDFEADTAHLTLAEDGAYNRLLRLCWRTPGCSIPDDKEWIYRRMRALTDEDRAVVDVVLAEFFVVAKGRCSNARLAREFANASGSYAARSAAGSKGGKAKALKYQGNGSSNARGLLKQCSSNQNQNHKEEKGNFSLEKEGDLTPPEAAALVAIGSGKRFLCTHIPPSTARALVARGMVTEGECKEVGVL